MKLKMKHEVSLIFILLVLHPILSYADQNTGSIEVDVKYTNGDRVDNYGMVLKIYQDFTKMPYKIIESLPDNPYNIPSLPIGHRYTVEVYVDSMYASVGYVNLQSNQQRLDMTIPLSGGMRFDVFFKDGTMPLEGATVLVKSHDGKQWGERITDDEGKTQRLWIQSTTLDSDYYIANIMLGKDINYTYSPIKLLPGGHQDYKVVTPWPSIVNELITTYVYDNSYTKVDKSDGAFVVELYNSKGDKVAESAVKRGEAFFSNLKVDTYDFRAKKIDGIIREDWGSTKATIIGSQKPVEIFKSVQEIRSEKFGSTENTEKPITSCNCVAFRLDNVQDYWLNNVQIEIIKTFQKKNIDLTMTIISTAFGEDPKITSFIRDKIKLNPKIEIANSGYEFKNFTSYDDKQLVSVLQKSNDKISAVLGVVPSVFVFPYGKINNAILESLYANKIMYLSTNTVTDQPPYPLSNFTLYRFPATTSTGHVLMNDGTLRQLTNDEIFAGIKNSLNDYGFAVVRLNFQHYAFNNDNKLENEVDHQQIQQLELLIDKIHDSGLRIVTIGEINLPESVDKIIIPSWIKNNAGWWAENKISDSDFISGIQHMMQKKIITIKDLPTSVQSKGEFVPSWIKNSAERWSEGKISDSDFAKDIKFLIREGMIRV